MFKYALLALILSCTSSISACSCSFGLPDIDVARNATQIFTFRLLNARVVPNTQYQGDGSDVIGQIDVIDDLRGKSAVREVRFSTHSCCGARLDVGGYFMAFTINAKSHLVVNSGNVIEINKGGASFKTAQENILSVLDGKKKFEDAFPRWILERTEQSPVLPPCPRRQ